MRATLVVASAVLLAGCGGGGTVQPPAPAVGDTIAVTSPAFDGGQPIPPDHTCHGAGRPPEVAWRGVPAGAKSLALVVTDPDARGGTFVHWLLYDLPPRDGRLAGGRPPPGAREAGNSGGKTGWYPPCPPSGTHHYVFTVYALREPAGGGSTQDILDAIGRAAIARGALTGLVAAG
ncbi:MAG: YbhB/YbcL family Raf kinase inhibitor-like protein [Mycobacteriales bacterium]